MNKIYITIVYLLLVTASCTSQNGTENRNPNTEDSKVEIENSSVPSPMK